MVYVEDLKLHEIFTVDPVLLRSYINQYVQVTLKNGSKLSGTVYTIDPVSQSLILIIKEDKSLIMKIVLNHCIKSINILSEIPKEQENIDFNELFRSNVSSKLHGDIKTERERVKLWLLKNMIPVEEVGDILKLETLEIHPPYGAENCCSSNVIVLDRIQNLLRELEQEQTIEN